MARKSSTCRISWHSHAKIPRNPYSSSTSQSKPQRRITSYSCENSEETCTAHSTPKKIRRSHTALSSNQFRPSKMIERQRPVFKAKENLDEEFASKFLLAVDTRFQMWLKQCRIARIRSDVDDSIIDFAHLVSQVFFGSFHITLPPTFKMKAPIDDSASNNDTKKHDGNNDGKGDNGKKKKKGDEAREMVQNKAPHPDLCMLSTETWAINFANKNVNSRPKFNDKSVMCPRWLLQKYCFNNCKHKDSHVKADEIPADKVTAMKEWIKSCRSNGN